MEDSHLANHHKGWGGFTAQHTPNDKGSGPAATLVGKNGVEAAAQTLLVTPTAATELAKAASPLTGRVKDPSSYTCTREGGNKKGQ